MTYDLVLTCEQDSQRKRWAGIPEERTGCAKIQDVYEASKNPKWLEWSNSEQCMMQR